MELSIVTVCYNAENIIEGTIKSVLNQDFKDYEYIFVDGGSEDKTNEIISRYKALFEGAGINVIHISEKDNGIYDAMNKGIRNAAGEWICFMNAGDTFYSDDTLKNVFEGRNRSHADVIYGDVEECDNKTSWISKAGKPERLLSGMTFCHQSSFVKTELAKENLFDTNYKICADYNMFLSFYMSGKNFIKLDQTVSRFSVDGVCHNNLVRHFTEKFEIQSKYGLADMESKEVKQVLRKMRVREMIKGAVPINILSFIRSFRKRKL